MIGSKSYAAVLFMDKSWSDRKNFLTMCHNIINCGFQGKPVLVQNNRIRQNIEKKYEVLFKLLCE